MALNLPALISRAVGLADSLTKSIQTTVQHRAWTSSNEWGNHTYSITVNYLRAIYEQKAESKFDVATGAVIQTQGKLTILEVPEPNGAPGRIEPIDNRDLITLPDGRTGSHLPAFYHKPRAQVRCGHAI